MSNVSPVDTCRRTDIARLISWVNMVVSTSIHLAQDKYSWRALVIPVRNLRVLLVQIEGNFFPQNIYTGSRVHPASHSMSTGILLLG